MSPNNPAPPGARELLGAMQAVQFAVSQMERKASTLIWTSSDTQADLDAAVKAIMAALITFSNEVAKYKAPKPIVSPPQCGPGFHLEFGICVSDNL